LALSSASASSSFAPASSARNFDSSVSPDSSPASSAPASASASMSAMRSAMRSNVSNALVSPRPCIVLAICCCASARFFRAMRMFFLRLASSILLLRRRSASFNFSTACFCATHWVWNCPATFSCSCLRASAWRARPSSPPRTATMALRSHSLALSCSATVCFCSFFSSAMATATAFLASASCCCISSSTWLSIFSGSSALVMRSLMLDLISVPSLEKIPMDFSRVAPVSRAYGINCHVATRRLRVIPRALAMSALPRHVGIIMDGNGRWAQLRGQPRLEGHRVGAESVRDITRAARQLGLEAITLYAFSAQNWARPADEVRGLMELLRDYLHDERAEIMDNQIRLHAIGDLDRLPAMVASRSTRSDATPPTTAAWC
jgi:hypothetical protein